MLGNEWWKRYKGFVLQNHLFVSLQVTTAIVPKNPTCSNEMTVLCMSCFFTTYILVHMQSCDGVPSMHHAIIKENSHRADRVPCFINTFRPGSAHSIVNISSVPSALPNN